MILFVAFVSSWLSVVLNICERSLEHFVLARAQSRDGRQHFDVRFDADKMMDGAPIVAGDAHSCKHDRETTGYRDRRDVAVRAGRRAADDGGEMAVVDVPHHRFGVADRAAVGEKDDLASQLWRNRLQIPAHALPAR